MNWWQAMLLGIVEGITEYLPVSSTGHLLLTQRLLRIPASEAADAYAICIQAGAILAVLGLYWPQVKKMLLGLLGKEPAGLRLAVNIVVAFLPAAVIGVLFDKKIEEYLFGLWPITAAWFVGGLAILAVSRWRRMHRTGAHEGGGLASLTIPMALTVGFAQCLAMWPGTSRSLVTILAGILVGLNLGAAVEFSFLLGVVTLTAATAFKAPPWWRPTAGPSCCSVSVLRRFQRPWPSNGWSPTCSATAWQSSATTGWYWPRSQVCCWSRGCCRISLTGLRTAGRPGKGAAG